MVTVINNVWDQGHTGTFPFTYKPASRSFDKGLIKGSEPLILAPFLKLTSGARLKILNPFHFRRHRNSFLLELTPTSDRSLSSLPAVVLL